MSPQLLCDMFAVDKTGLFIIIQEAKLSQTDSAIIVSLNISLTHSRLLEVIRNDTLE